MTTEWVSAPEAIRRLGVRPQTLYAYASRGMVRRERVPGRRTVRYRAEDVDRLVARGRGGAAGAAHVDVAIETALTSIDPAGGLTYRGWDVLEAAAAATYEEVATWLWTGILPRRVTWRAEPAAAAVARRTLRALPRSVAPADRLRVVTAAIAATVPLAGGHRDQHEVVAAAGPFVAALLEGLPLVGPEPSGSSIAERLWPRLAEERPSRPGLALLDACLVLLADHELATSTVAARVTASTWASPGMVVLSGMAAMAGPLHGANPEQVRAALRSGVAEGERVPGLGHAVYVGVDPRYTAIRSRLEAMRGTRSVLDGIDALAARYPARLPNVDLALGAFAEHAGMVEGATEAIFTIARTAGWIAHGLEEYRHRLRFRGRATYVGPRP
jgi:citrate synthase